MKIKSINLAWINSTDLDKSKKFFCDILGLKLAVDSTQYKWLELESSEGETRLGVGQEDSYSPIKAGNNAIITLTVEDIIAAKSELESHKVKISGDIVEVPGHVKMLLFQDPDGNFFQLVQILS